MRYLALWLFLVFPVWPALAEDSVTTQNFAYGFPLKIESGGAIYSLAIPEEVYRTVRRADFGDVRIFNAAGEAVPHLLREAGENEADLHVTESIPFFPLLEGVEGGNGSGAAVNIKRNADGVIVSIATDSTVAIDKSEKRNYLLDLSGLARETGKLEFTWRDGPPFITVQLLETDDLVRWRPLVDRAILADLEYRGHRIAQKTLILPVKPLRYLKLVGHEGQSLPDLQRVTAFSERLAERTQRRWLSLDEGRVGQNERRTVIDYDAGGHLPVDAVKLHFPEKNSMLRATVQSRSDITGPWISRCSTVFFSLKIEDSTIDNGICSFRPVSDSHWRVEIIEDGAGVGKDNPVPSLELGWTAAELLFVARGSAPFTLAFGSGKLKEAADRPGIGMVLQAVSGKDSEHVIKPAFVGERFDLGGKNALLAPTPPVPWKQWLLWTTLILGVAFLTFMVKHLLREMKNET